MGLYWIAKDLHERDPSFVQALDPEAKASAEVRNRLEHKYLKLHEMAPLDASTGFADRSDPLAYSVSRAEFERRTLRLLLSARTALMQLIQVVLVEEHLRGKRKGKVTKVATVQLFSFRDEFKR